LGPDGSEDEPDPEGCEEEPDTFTANALDAALVPADVVSVAVKA
jgi:hypothetical protein